MLKNILFVWSPVWRVCRTFGLLKAGLTKMLQGLGGKNTKFCRWSEITPVSVLVERPRACGGQKLSTSPECDYHKRSRVFVTYLGSLASRMREVLVPFCLTLVRCI